MSAPVQPTTPDSVRAENLEKAYILWDRRQRRLENPDGTFDNAGRWFPSPEEHCPCCNAIRTPSRHWPYSLVKHCRSVQHVANLCGMSASDLRKEIRRRNPPVKKPVQEHYYKAVVNLDDGRYCSTFDGKDTIYEIGVTLRQVARPRHEGGYYVLPTPQDVEAFLNENEALSQPGNSYTVLRCRCAGRKVSYGNGKLAFSEITPLEVVGTIDFVDTDSAEEYAEEYEEEYEDFDDYDNNEYPELDDCDECSEHDDSEFYCDEDYEYYLK